MKQVLLTLGLSILIIPATFGQLYDSWYDLAFDTEMSLQHLTIDTISNPNNIWQIGPPQKTIFTSAFSTPNALVTDTINTYPTNDTSAFIITNVAMGQGFEWPHTVILAGEYFVNSDTLTDYGMIEFSPDNGTTWIDLLNDTITGTVEGYQYQWYWGSYQKPTLSGNSNQWKSFWVDLAKAGYIYNVHDGDTVLYRFTFISDSIQTNKDGLMFDNLHFENWVEGIEEIGFALMKSQCFPNPTKNALTISFDNYQNSSFDLYIYNAIGMEITKTTTNSNKVNLSVSKYKQGAYFYKLVDKTHKKFTIGRFIKE